MCVLCVHDCVYSTLKKICELSCVQSHVLMHDIIILKDAAFRAETAASFCFTAWPASLTMCFCRDVRRGNSLSTGCLLMPVDSQI